VSISLTENDTDFFNIMLYIYTHTHIKIGFLVFCINTVSHVPNYIAVSICVNIV
jgi:hypothetical protein